MFIFKKHIDRRAVLKGAGVKETPQLDRFFNFALAKKAVADLQTKGWKP